MSIKVTVRTDKLHRLQGSIQTRSADAVRENAAFCRDFAASISPIRTGALRQSWYVSGPFNESDYAMRAAAAKELNPQAVILEEAKAAIVDPNVGQLRSNLGQFALPECIVSSAVNYSLFLEEGTRYMAAQPILHPAAETTRVRFVDSMKSIADV